MLRIIEFNVNKKFFFKIAVKLSIIVFFVKKEDNLGDTTVFYYGTVRLIEGAQKKVEWLKTWPLEKNPQF